MAVKNAHPGFGWHIYEEHRQNNDQHQTSPCRFIGEVLRDPPRQANAHLISVLAEIRKSRRPAPPFRPEVDLSIYVEGLAESPFALGQSVKYRHSSH